MDVEHKFIVCYRHVAKSRCQTQHFIHPESILDFTFIHYGHHILIVAQQGREFAILIKARTQDM